MKEILRLILKNIKSKNNFLKKILKTCLIIDETYFFHPKFVNDLCNNKNCEIVAAILAKKSLPKILFAVLVEKYFKTLFF